MSTVVRMWLGLAAFSAGIIHLALTVSSPLPVAISLGVLGGAELIWGVLAFVRSRLVLPRVVLFAALAPTLFWAVLVAIAASANAPAVASYLGFEAMSIATLLGLFIAVVLAVHVRRRADFTLPTRETTTWRYLGGVVAGGILAAMIVTPALAATDAGRYAKPMGDMNMGLTSVTIQPSHR
jgi:hypothetical protein